MKNDIIKEKFELYSNLIKKYAEDTYQEFYNFYLYHHNIKNSNFI